MKQNTSRFFFELWGKDYCPIKHLPFEFGLPLNDSILFNIEQVVSYCLGKGYKCHFCISLPDENSRAVRLELQSTIARPFHLSADDWQVSEHSALRLFNTLSPQQQDVFFRIPYMTTSQIMDDLRMKYNAVRSAESIIHSKMRCCTKEELNAMLIIIGFYCQPPLNLPPDIPVIKFP